MTRAVRLHRQAEAELAGVVAFYEGKQRGLGLQLIVAVDHALDDIVESPGSSPIWKLGQPYRRHLLKRFPYLVVFTLESNLINVVAIAHTKRNPGYWIGR
ncbi:MAG: type II toxin-antitoxin system RelE/ParE family toxin [Polyangiaceae bacterium]|nr:type II toxin-antitoxin system RelE/ParE family toxin [Polyangiaceae bacterium]